MLPVATRRQPVVCTHPAYSRRKPGDQAANNYADTLVNLEWFEEARSVLRKTMPAARRVLGEGHRLTLSMRSIYAEVLYKDASSTLDDLREAVETLEDVERIARRVFGGAHRITANFERHLQASRLRLERAVRK